MCDLVEISAQEEIVYVRLLRSFLFYLTQNPSLSFQLKDFIAV